MADRATDDPTRPAPTMRMNIEANITQRTGEQTSPGGQAQPSRNGGAALMPWSVPSGAGVAGAGAGGSEDGGAVRMTSQAALETTYFVASPTKLSIGPPRPPSSAPPRI